MRRALEAVKYKMLNRKWKFLDIVHLLMLGVSVVIFVNVTVRLNMLHQERVAYKNMYETLRLVKDLDSTANAQDTNSTASDQQNLQEQAVPPGGGEGGDPPIGPGQPDAAGQVLLNDGMQPPGAPPVEAPQEPPVAETGNISNTGQPLPSLNNTLPINEPQPAATSMAGDSPNPAMNGTSTILQQPNNTDLALGAPSPAVTSGDNPLPLVETLRTIHDARGNNLVILSIVDADYLDMAHNFYEFSIVPYGLQDNFIYMAAFAELCTPLRAQGANCYVHQVNPTRTEELQKLEYRRKLRGETVLAALNANMTVLHTHVDVAFTKNPLPELICGNCVVQTFNDVVNGDRVTLDFVWLRPTEHTLLVWKTFKETCLRDITGPSVDSFNKALRQYKPYIITKILDPNKFMPGVQFFESLNHTFAEPDHGCADCVVIHNNWIVTRAAKVYRFKENHLWNYDKDGYYSNPDARYIVYENPVMFGNTTFEEEREALKSALALGRVLNRIVVLPKFHCGNIMCGVNSVFSVASLNSVFGANYRENTFLSHSKVPPSVRINTTDLLWIETGAFEGHDVDMKGAVKVQMPEVQGDAIIINDDIVNSFQLYQPYPIIKFHSLYRVYSKYMEKKPEFEQDIEKGLLRDVYRQHRTSWTQ